jgi:Gluconate 2-dehydrogenase subunit 3
MNRRTVIRNVLAFSAGAILVPSCMHDEGRVSISLKNISITGEQEKLLQSLSETIIPTTATPGAKELSSHLFMLMMVDDCMNKENQGKFTRGLAQFDEFSKKKSGTGFVASSPAQKAALLTEIESKKDIPEDLRVFYGTAKRFTIQSFVSSQYFLTKIQPYEMIPGRYHGCVPVKTKTAHG